MLFGILTFAIFSEMFISFNNAHTPEIVITVELIIKSDLFPVSPHPFSETRLLNTVKFPAQPGARHYAISTLRNDMHLSHSYNLFLYPQVRLNILANFMTDM